MMIVCALLCLCGCNAPQKTQPIPQQDAPRQGTTPTQPSGTATSDDNLAARETVENFAQALGVDVDAVEAETFVFATLNEKRLNVDGFSLTKSQYPAEKSALLDDLFAQWSIYSYGVWHEDTIMLYTADNLVCKRHLIYNAADMETGHMSATYDVHISCGAHIMTPDELHPQEMAGEQDCVDAKVWFISQSDDIKPYIALKETSGNSFVLKKQYDTTTYDNYFELLEKRRKSDGSFVEFPIMHFQCNDDAGICQRHYPETQTLEDLHYTDPTVVDTFRSKCAQEVEMRSDAEYERLL